MGVVKRAVDAFRWRRLLASCRLDPPAMQNPRPRPIGPNDFIIAGCPRTGTSLLAAQLFQPPHVVTVMEPWDGLRIEPADLFTSLRSEINSGSLQRGRLDIDALDRGEVVWRGESESAHEIDAAPGFELGVKWPTFWQYLDVLPKARFLITVRHPTEVISSFARVGGRLASGLEYDVAFNRTINGDLASATRDPEVRTVMMYEYVNSRIIPHLHRPEVMVVRYERWHQDPRALLSEISSFLGVELSNNVSVTPPTAPEHSPRLSELIRRHAPSAISLGYGV